MTLTLTLPQKQSSYLDFQYDVDSVVPATIRSGSIGEWTAQELKSICHKHELSVRGTKTDLVQGVTSHYGCASMP